MATAYVSPENVSFDDQLIQIRAEIEAYFKLLVDILKERESELLSELDEIASSHKREKDQHKQSLSEIEIMFKQTHIHSNIPKAKQGGICKILEEQQKEFESELNSKIILFDYNHILLHEIVRHGEITVVNSNSSCLPLVDYKFKLMPVVSFGGIGTNEGKFDTLGVCLWTTLLVIFMW